MTVFEGKMPANKHFGLLFASIFAISSIYFALHGMLLLAIMALFSSIIFLCLSFLAPTLLEPANKIWMRIGLLMGSVISPLILGFLFYLLFTPISLLTRLFGRDELNLHKGEDATFWTSKSSAERKLASFKRQF